MDEGKLVSGKLGKVKLRLIKSLIKEKDESLTRVRHKVKVLRKKPVQT